MHQIIRHDITSGGHKVAPHNVVPLGNAWCIMCLLYTLEIYSEAAISAGVETRGA